MKKIRLRYNDKLAIYFLISVFNVVYIGVFGVRVAISNLFKKWEIREEIISIRSNISSQIEALDKLEADLLYSEPYIESLNNSIPYTENLDVYLIDFISVAAKHGLTVKKFSIQTPSDETNTVITELSGNADNIPNFLAEIENLERITNIKRVNIDSRKKASEIRLEFVIYKT